MLSLKLTNVYAPSATDDVAADKKRKYEHCATHTTQKIPTHAHWKMQQTEQVWLKNYDKFLALITSFVEYVKRSM